MLGGFEKELASGDWTVIFWFCHQQGQFAVFLHSDHVMHQHHSEEGVRVRQQLLRKKQRFATILPVFPDNLRPMPLKRHKEPFSHPDFWLFEIKQDGFRALAFVNLKCKTCCAECVALRAFFTPARSSRPFSGSRELNPENV